MAKTVTMVLTKPAKRSGGKTDAWDFASMDGEKFTTFDEDLVEAFLKANLAGVERAYDTVPSKNPKYAPTVVGIPGVYEDPGPGGGNKQKAAQTPGGGSGAPYPEGAALGAAALFVAARGGTSRQVLVVAASWLKWLKTGEIPEDRSTSGGGPTPPPGEKAGRPDNAPAPAAPPANPSGNKALILAEALKVWPDRPALAEAWAKGLGENLTDEQVKMALAELATMNGLNAEPMEEASSGTAG